MKITDKILAKGTEPHIAFEYFPPRTEEGVKNLTRRFKLMASQEPLCVAASAARSSGMARARGPRARCAPRHRHAARWLTRAQLALSLSQVRRHDVGRGRRHV